MAEETRLKFRPQKCDTKKESLFQHDFYAFYSRMGAAVWKLYIPKVW